MCGIAQHIKTDVDTGRQQAAPCAFSECHRDDRIKLAMDQMDDREWVLVGR